MARFGRTTGRVTIKGPTFAALHQNLGISVPVEVSTPSPPPFPGGVLAVVNQFGTPPPAIASGELSQIQVSTPSPEPFPGGVTMVSLRAPVQPPSIPGQLIGPGESRLFPGAVRTGEDTLFGIAAVTAQQGQPRRIETASERFPGGVTVGRPRVETVRDSLPTPMVARTFEPPAEVRQPALSSGTPAREAVKPPVRIVAPLEPPAFAGQVVTRRSDFGIAAVTDRGVSSVVRLDETAKESGRVIVSDKRADAGITKTGRATIAAVLAEAPSSLTQPTLWSGTPARQAATVQLPPVATASPPAFPGSVHSLHPVFALSSLPSVRPTVAQLAEVPREPGRVVAHAGHVATVRPIGTIPIIVATSDNALSLPQPIYWSGTHERPAVNAPIPVVRTESLPVFAGAVHARRSDFGVSPIPAKPVIVRQTEGSTPIEPGQVILTRATPTDPIRRQPSAIIAALPSVPYAGESVFIGGHALPSTRPPAPTIISGNMGFAQPVAPFFGFGWRTGTGAPPGPATGYPVTLYGYDRSVITLTSLDSCGC